MALCSSIIVAALAAWPVIRIVRALDAGQNEARSAFAEIRRTALNIVSGPVDASGGAWRSSAQDVWEKQDSLLAVIVKDPSGEVLYARPGSSPYYKRAPEGLSFERPQGSTSSFSGALSSGLVIEALYVTLSQEDVYRPVRDAALAYLGLLAAIVAALIVVSNSRTGIVEAAAGTAEAKADVLADWTPSIPELAPEESSLYSEDPSEPALKTIPSSAAKVETSVGNVSTADLPDGALEGPRGLFDSDSGLGWEAYLRERLGAELRRSASFEQDLSLLITTLDGAHRGEEEFNLFASQVRDFFSFKDMAFLFGDGGAALILPNIDVDHALRMSEELLKKLQFMFQSRLAGDGAGIRMGLTSRAGRLVDADRLIGEAMAATDKARNDGGARIMAFRPDPEKFRAYLAGQ